jgi:hypothetical protein
VAPRKTSPSPAYADAILGRGRPKAPTPSDAAPPGPPGPAADDAADAADSSAGTSSTIPLIIGAGVILGLLLTRRKD